MLTLNKIGGSNNLKEAEFYCLAKDIKPIDKEIPNGSKLHIIDYKEQGTPSDYVFDAESLTWKEKPLPSGGGGEGGVSSYPQLINKPKINGVDLVGNKTSADLSLASLEDIQNLEDGKANYAYKVIATDKVSQADAREVLTFLDQYEGKLIEFLTNGDLPSKCVATGRIMTDKQGNSYLLTYNLDGTVTQWNKDSFEKHTVESYNYTNQMTDLDNLTIDVQGQAPFMATVNKAFNKPQESSDFGSVFVFAYNTEKQIQIYRDMESGRVWQKLITGQADNHSFGTWNEVGGSGKDNSLGITNATVGQIAEIEQVDETGKPTKWKAVEKPSGSGETEKIEKVGATPYNVSEKGLFVKPPVPCRVYSEGGTPNILANLNDFTIELDKGYPTTNKPHIVVNYKIEGNKFIALNGSEESENWPMFYIKNINLQKGDYSLFVSGGKKNYWVKLAEDIKGAEDMANTTNGRLQFSLLKETKIVIKLSQFFNIEYPMQFEFYLYAGTYDKIPEGGSPLDFDVKADETLNLDAFNGKKVLSEPSGISIYKYITDVTSYGNIICFGDSIMTLGEGKNLVDCLKDLKVPAISMAVSGATIAKSGTITERPYDMCNIVDSLERKDLSAQINGNQQSNFKNLLTLMDTAKVLVLEFGTNDFQGEKRLEGEDNTSIKGAYRYVLQKLSTMYPEKKIIVLSTLSSTLKGDVNESGMTLHQMAEGVKQVCDEFYIPFVDSLNKCGINRYNKSRFTVDGVHLSLLGKEFYAKFLKGQLISLGCV